MQYLTALTIRRQLIDLGHIGVRVLGRGDKTRVVISGEHEIVLEHDNQAELFVSRAVEEQQRLKLVEHFNFIVSGVK